MLNNKPFVNSSKTTIKCVVRHIHLSVHINAFIFTNETEMVDSPPDMPAKGELFCKIDTTSTRSMTPIVSHGLSDIVFANHGCLHNTQAIRLFLEIAATDMDMDYHPCCLTLG